jgi:hypothetical protein
MTRRARYFVFWTQRCSEQRCSSVAFGSGLPASLAWRRASWRSTARRSEDRRRVRIRGNKLAAIKALLDTLVLKGCIVTMDALGCQTKVAEKIIRSEKKSSLRRCVNGRWRRPGRYATSFSAQCVVDGRGTAAIGRSQPGRQPGDGRRTAGADFPVMARGAPRR